MSAVMEDVAVNGALIVLEDNGIAAGQSVWYDGVYVGKVYRVEDGWTDKHAAGQTSKLPIVAASRMVERTLNARQEAAKRAGIEARIEKLEDDLVRRSQDVKTAYRQEAQETAKLIADECAVIQQDLLTAYRTFYDQAITARKAKSR
jgi:hypothetical protein